MKIRLSCLVMVVPSVNAECFLIRRCVLLPSPLPYLQFDKHNEALYKVYFGEFVQTRPVLIDRLAVRVTFKLFASIATSGNTKQIFIIWVNAKKSSTFFCLDIDIRSFLLIYLFKENSICCMRYGFPGKHLFLYIRLHANWEIPLF